MKTTDPTPADPEMAVSSTPSIEPDEPTLATASADPIVAEEVGHPIGVGIGAMGAGAAGAAIGAVVGPLGMLVGAALGAVAGGIVGKEVAAAGEEAATENPDGSYTNPDLAGSPALGLAPSTFGLGAEPAGGSVLTGSEAEDVDSAEYPEDDVRLSAYYRYLERQAGGIDGDEVGDWVEAERAVLHA